MLMLSKDDIFKSLEYNRELIFFNFLNGLEKIQRFSFFYSNVLFNFFCEFKKLNGKLAFVFHPKKFYKSRKVFFFQDFFLQFNLKMHRSVFFFNAVLDNFFNSLFSKFLRVFKVFRFLPFPDFKNFSLDKEILNPNSKNFFFLNMITNSNFVFFKRIQTRFFFLTKYKQFVLNSFSFFKRRKAEKRKFKKRKSKVENSKKIALRNLNIFSKFFREKFVFFFSTNFFYFSKSIFPLLFNLNYRRFFFFLEFFLIFFFFKYFEEFKIFKRFKKYLSRTYFYSLIRRFFFSKKKVFLKSFFNLFDLMKKYKNDFLHFPVYFEDFDSTISRFFLHFSRVSSFSKIFDRRFRKFWNLKIFKFNFFSFLKKKYSFFKENFFFKINSFKALKKNKVGFKFSKLLSRFFLWLGTFFSFPKLLVGISRLPFIF